MHRVSCKYGTKCYRHNPAHRHEESHPGDVDYTLPTYKDAPAGAPLCPFATVGCYRRNPLHFQLFSHTLPTSSVPSMSTSLLCPSSPPSVAQSNTFDTVPLDSGNDDSDVTLIKDIDPKNTKTTIKARVIIKSDKHPFNSRFGPGEMFTINLIDRSGEITIKAYGACVDKFFDQIQVDRIYNFINFKVKNSDTEKNGSIMINQFYLQFMKNTEIESVHPVKDFPTLTFQFQSLKYIVSKKRNETIDVIGICREYGSLEDVKLASKCPGRKRELILMDQTGQVTITVWGTNAESFSNYKPGCVVALKRGRVMNKPVKNSLDASCLASCTYQINPDIPESKELIKWWSEQSRQVK